ncbi:threonine/serine exporter family protein [Staphylococcus coagulans]|uniref:threonine/serine exporter family protein n=1 Tax=Staphylococcus coagulans TaxID=74706 RepID=UPI001BE9C5F0|nr:threonine/serine exporter family protein [Staphylococcus coagulans]MBT2831299.1 threonine/serine exporter family protein [Staphylococcus coagulans]MBT2860765.1 threonine/serine exporter family protein [Staphylococcus coagulans]
MTQIIPSDREVTNLVILAGRILLECGAEATRVEDTMKRIAQSYGYDEAQGYALNIFINFSLSPDHDTRIVKIKKNDTNLRNVYLVNHISRQIAQHAIDFDRAYNILKEIEQKQPRYALGHKMLFAGMISLGFSYLQGAFWIDVFPAVLAGALGYFVTEWMKNKQLTLFIPDFLGAITIGLIAIPLNHWLGSPNIGATITAAVMPIVPGVLITTAIQDLFGRHMLMFTAKFLEAIVTSFAIGAGVTTAFLIL